MGYASKYYDPVKAHEYYEEHKKLKGRRKKLSTKDLNESGKIAAKKVKENIQAERKERVAELRNSVKEEISAHNEEMKEKIAELREEFKGLSKAQKAERREELYEEIAELRNEHRAFSSELRETLAPQIAQFKKEAEDTYLQELMKIKKDPAFLK